MRKKKVLNRIIFKNTKKMKVKNCWDIKMFTKQCLVLSDILCYLGKRKSLYHFLLRGNVQ